ncbi:MAG: helix-turn-helix domain-containing protein [Candidatus Thorarchaeota archaeon]|jgi:hypothetical protein
MKNNSDSKLRQEISRLYKLLEEEPLPQIIPRKKSDYIKLPEVSLLIVELYDSGKNMSDLSKLFQVSNTAIRNLLLREDVEIRPQKRDDITAERSLELFLEGESCKGMAKKLKCSAGLIRKRLGNYYEDLIQARSEVYRKLKRLTPEKLSEYRKHGESFSNLEKKLGVSRQTIRDVMRQDDKARQYIHPFENGEINETLLDAMIENKVNAWKICYLFIGLTMDELKGHAKRKGYELNMKEAPIIGTSGKGISSRGILQRLSRGQQLKEIAKEIGCSSENLTHRLKVVGKYRNLGKREDVTNEDLIEWRKQGLFWSEIRGKFGGIGRRLGENRELATACNIRMEDGEYNLELIKAMYENDVPLQKIRRMAQCKKEELIKIFGDIGIHISEEFLTQIEPYNSRVDIQAEDVRKDFEKMGYNMRAVAKKYKTSPATIKSRLLEAEFDFDSIKGITTEEIVRMRKEGMKVEEIAEYCGVTDSAIYQRLRKYKNCEKRKK